MKEEAGGKEAKKQRSRDAEKQKSREAKRHRCIEAERQSGSRQKGIDA